MQKTTKCHKPEDYNLNVQDYKVSQTKTLQSECRRLQSVTNQKATIWTITVAKAAECVYRSISCHYFILYFSDFLGSGVKLCPLGSSATISHRRQMIDDDECGAVGGMGTGRGNRSTRRKSAPLPLSLQIPHELTGAPIRAATVGSQRPVMNLWVPR
jgi:hypothetical protein